MRRIRTIWAIIALSVLFAIVSAAGIAEGEGLYPNLLLSGKSERPITVTVSAPSYTMIPPYGNERTDELNALLKHAAVEITTDGDNAECVILIDGSPLLSLTQKTDGDAVKTVYSQQNETVYIESAEDGADALTLFMDDRFFYVNRMMDELIGVFEKLPEVYPDKAKTSAESINFKGYGKAVSKVAVTLKEEAEIEEIQSVLCGLTECDELKDMIHSLLFRGTQKIVMLMGENGKPIRIIYDGTTGFYEEDLRKVSLNWKSFRSDESKKDEMILKAPAVSGNERDNMTYSRELCRDEEERDTLEWNMQLDLKDAQDRQEIQFSGEYSFADTEIDGMSILSRRQDGVKTKKIVSLKLAKENGGDYCGTIEITDNSGKILTGGMTAGILFTVGKQVSFVENDKRIVDLREGKNEEEAQSLQTILADSLIRRLALLPAEDLAFFRRDLPADIWETLTQIIK